MPAMSSLFYTISKQHHFYSSPCLGWRDVMGHLPFTHLVTPNPQYLYASTSSFELLILDKSTVAPLLAAWLKVYPWSTARTGKSTVIDYMRRGGFSTELPAFLTDLLALALLPPSVSRPLWARPNARPLSGGHRGCPSHVEVAHPAERCMLRGVITDLQLPPSTVFGALGPTNQIYHVSWHAPLTHK